MNKAPVSNKIQRGIKAATAVAKVGANATSHFIKRPFLSDDKRRTAKENLDKKNAKTIFDTLTQLRGAPLKIAQFISQITHFLPPAYVEKFEKSFQDVLPLNRALIRHQFIAELGGAPEDIFDTFEEEAFAAASLGQAHRARLRSGKEVAVKIQYPGIARSIKSDLDTLGLALMAMPNSAVWLVFLDEIRERLTEEVDYLNEAKNIKWFAKRVDDDDYIFPEPVEEFSTRKILTMKYINGETLYEFAKAKHPTQMRNHVAQKLWDINVKQLYGLRRVQSDAHPGNYIACGGKIGLLDFGCVKKVPEKFAVNHLEFMKSMRARDKQETYEQLGKLMEQDKTFDGERKEAQQELLWDFAEHAMEIFNTKNFDFGDEKYLENAEKNAFEFFSKADVFPGARDFIFIDRLLFGLPLLFHKLRAKATLWLPEKVG